MTPLPALDEDLQGSHHGAGLSRLETAVTPQKSHDRIVEQIIKARFAFDLRIPSAISHRPLAGKANSGEAPFPFWVQHLVPPCMDDDQATEPAGTHRKGAPLTHRTYSTLGSGFLRGPEEPSCWPEKRGEPGRPAALLQA
jgi:hypothetical protein